MSERILLDLDQLCRRLNVSRQWFARDSNRKRLKAQGFPPPVPGMGRRWDPLAIDAWLDRATGRPGQEKVPAPQIDPTRNIEEVRHTLQRRLDHMGVCH